MRAKMLKKHHLCPSSYPFRYIHSETRKVQNHCKIWSTFLKESKWCSIGLAYHNSEFISENPKLFRTSWSLPTYYNNLNKLVGVNYPNTVPIFASVSFQLQYNCWFERFWIPFHNFLFMFLYSTFAKHYLQQSMNQNVSTTRCTFYWSS